MAMLPRRPRLLALAWLAVALLLAVATGGCLCRSVPAAAGLPYRSLLQATPPSPDTTVPPPPFTFPQPICRRPGCPRRCPPEGCSDTVGSP